MEHYKLMINANGTSSMYSWTLWIKSPNNEDISSQRPSNEMLAEAKFLLMHPDDIWTRQGRISLSKDILLISQRSVKCQKASVCLNNTNANLEWSKLQIVDIEIVATTGKLLDYNLRGELINKY